MDAPMTRMDRGRWAMAIALGVLLAAPLAGCWQRDVGRSHYPSGQLRSEAALKDGMLEGRAVMYFENGTPSEEL